jgi:hypothetical protein
MKRMLICAALLACVAACSSPTPAPNTGAAANGNTAATPATAASPTTAATSANDAIIAQEKQVWDAIKNKDFDGFASMLADDQIYVSDDGSHDKADTIKGVKELALTDVALSDWKVMNLDKEAALVTYTLNIKGTANGKPLPPVPMHASTAWMKRNGKWMALYHQDTEVAPAPTPAPASSPQAKQGAAPAPSPPQATGSSVDPKFKEQQVWDALKRRDFDAFAAFLADDFMEVEPDAVTNKADSVKGVQQVDFARVVLSDFKLLNFDKDFSNDVSLVTYLVKGDPKFWGESGQRHTTIWTHREGKWLAAFHQGTPQKKPNAK